MAVIVLIKWEVFRLAAKTPTHGECNEEIQNQALVVTFLLLMHAWASQLRTFGMVFGDLQSCRLVRSELRQIVFGIGGFSDSPSVNDKVSCRRL